MRILEYLYLMLWPFVSLVLGLVGGLIIGAFTTLVVFAITLLRTPMHIVKMMYVTATTEVCFRRGQYFDPILRVAVFLLVPIPHLIWLVGVTVFCLFCGTLYYISKATKTVYQRDYQVACTKASSNVRLEKESHLGCYIQDCQDYMEEDEESHATIYFLKAICAAVPGILLGALPFIPFSISVLFITLYRLPINVFKTMIVAFNTVTLKLDLKLCALLLLPLVHAIFPLVVSATALLGNFFFFSYSTTESIAEGKSPFHKWNEFTKGLQEYYKAHQRFVGEGFLGRYDDPTGIPSGWRGESYGLPIRKILKWQWDFLVCCMFLLVGFPVCLVGSLSIFAVKLIPGILSWWRLQCKKYSGLSTAEFLGCWAFYLLGFVLTPAGAALAAVIATFAGTMMSFQIPYTYLKRGCVAGLCAPLGVLVAVDSWDFFDLDGFRVFACIPETIRNWDVYQVDAPDHSQAGSIEERRTFAQSYWDRFASQCIRSTSTLLEEKWITLDQIQGMEPSAIQTIPAVALLDVLVDTVHDAEATCDEDISWKVDGTLCRSESRPRLDNIAALLWPRVLEIKRMLLSGRPKKILAEEANVKIMTALLCSNTDEATPALEAFLKSQSIEDSPYLASIKKVRSLLIELALMVLRVKPFQDRMTAIFEFKYDGLEGGYENEQIGYA